MSTHCVLRETGQLPLYFYWFHSFDLHPDPLNTWKTTHGDTIRKKAAFDMQPTKAHWIFNQLGNAKFGSEKSTKLLM